MSVDAIVASWKEVRSGLIDEASQIPADKFSFQAAAGMRSVAQLLQHLVESQKFLVGEACRPDTNLMRKSFCRTDQGLRAQRPRCWWQRRHPQLVGLGDG